MPREFENISYVSPEQIIRIALTKEAANKTIFYRLKDRQKE